MPYPYHRTFGLAIGLGMLLVGIGFTIAATLDAGANQFVVGAFVGAGLTLAIIATVLWALVDKPVVDPYKQPPPDYGHAEEKH